MKISSVLWEFFKSHYLRIERPPAIESYRRLLFVSTQCEGEPPELPHLSTLMRKLRREIPTDQIILAREGRAAAMRYARRNRFRKPE